MKPAIFSHFDQTTHFERAVRMIAEAGFESIGLSFSGMSSYEVSGAGAGIKKILEANHISIDSVHAPFPEGDELFSIDEARRAESLMLCKQAIDISALLGGGAVALHLAYIDQYMRRHGYELNAGPAPGSNNLKNRMIASGRKSIGELVEYAVKRGVNLGLENGQKTDYNILLEAFLKEFDSPAMGLCYDTGHEHVLGTGFSMLEKHIARVNSLHVHDNLGSDTHMLPYEGRIDWERFCSVLRRAGYAGDICLEASTKSSEFKDPEWFLFEAKKRAESLVRLASPDIRTQKPG